jgi:hypothetical protein
MGLSDQVLLFISEPGQLLVSTSSLLLEFL